MKMANEEHETVTAIIETSEELNLYLIDRSAHLHAGLIDAILSQAGYNVNLHPYTNQSEGLANLNGHLNTIILAGIEGNSIETKFDLAEAWAALSPREFNRRVREQSPRAKIVTYTGGAYSREDAQRDGADAYLFKIDVSTKLVDTVRAVMEGANK